MGVSSRLQDRRRDAKERRERRSSSKRGPYSLRLEISEDPQWIHPQRPNKPYPDFGNSENQYWWLRGAKHYIAHLNKFLECPSDAPCLTCTYREPRAFGKNDVPVNSQLAKYPPKDYYSMCGWVEEWHHVVKEKYTKDGEEKESFKRKLCSGRGCKHCRNKDPKVFGKRFYYDFSSPAWHNEVADVYEQVERRCRDGIGYIFPINYVCEECGEEMSFIVEDEEGRKFVVPMDVTQNCSSCGSDDIVIDHEDDKAECQNCGGRWTTLEGEDSQLKEAVESQLKCVKHPDGKHDGCGHIGYPVLVQAYLDTQSGECMLLEDYVEEHEEPDTYDIFDVAMRIRKTGKDKNTRLKIDEWEIRDPDERLFEVKHQGDDDLEMAEKMVKRHMEPLDLRTLHQPDLPAAQAKLLGVENLYADTDGSNYRRQTKSYSRKSSGDDGEERADT